MLNVKRSNLQTMRLKPYHLALLAVGAVTINTISCRASIPKRARAVNPFDVQKYLGKWFEIARLDFKYEKNLRNVTAVYSWNKNGTIRVENRGYDFKKNKWKESIGKAKFVNKKHNGRLKVSFFGPFYAGYNVIAVDDDYQYALVAGNDLYNMWILSRKPSIPNTIRKSYLKLAEGIGHDITKLIWTKHVDENNISTKEE